MRFNYQPGKSQLVLLTATVSPLGGGAGITRSFGQFDDKNGVFLGIMREFLSLLFVVMLRELLLTTVLFRQSGT